MQAASSTLYWLLDLQDYGGPELNRISNIPARPG